MFVALGLLENRDHVPGRHLLYYPRLRLLTPGRETAAEDEHSQQANSEHPDKGALVIAGLGGKENVCAVGNCFTRLRVDAGPRPYPADAVERERREQRAD